MFRRRFNIPIRALQPPDFSTRYSYELAIDFNAVVNSMVFIFLQEKYPEEWGGWRAQTSTVIGLEKA